MEGEQTCGGRRRRRLDSSAMANLALKMPRCDVRLENIKVEKEKERVREVVEEYQKETEGLMDDDQDCELEVCSGPSDKEDSVDAIINDESEPKEDDAIKCSEKEDSVAALLNEESDASNTDKKITEPRVTRQRVKLLKEPGTGPEDQAVSLEPPAVPARRAPSSRQAGHRAETVQTSPVKFKSVKTGRVFEKHPCDQCDKVFSSSMGLQLHSSSHLLECKLCSLTFTTSQLLKTHTEQHITSLSGGPQAHLHCEECGKEFPTKKLVKKHSEIPDIHKRPYSCSLGTCERTFTRAAQLANHRQFHPDPRHLECEKCFLKFSTQPGLSWHQNLVNCGKQSPVPTPRVEKQFLCTECPRTFSKKEYLEMHKYYHWDSTDRALPCKVSTCMLSFSSRFKLERHMVEHTTLVKEGMFICSKGSCQEERFNDPMSLKNHLENHSKVETCQICGLSFDTKLDMLLHRVLCVEVKESFECTVCKKTFKAKRFLINHLSFCGKIDILKDASGGAAVSRDNQEYQISPVVGPDKPAAAPASLQMRCDQPGCGKTFNRFILLKNHLYSHTDNPFHCMQECQLSFSQLGSYKNHCRAEHGGEFGFLSCEKCEEVFTVISHLENHTEKFHEKSLDLEIFDDAQFYDSLSILPGPFLCKHSNCAAQHSLRSQLRSHYSSHHTLDLTCSLCLAKFDDRPSLAQHRVAEHSIACPPVLCPFCQDTFLSSQYLRIHILSAHPQPWSCSQTGCTFSPTYLLEASMHMQTHQVRSCDWPQCGEVFPSRGDLMEHIQTHSSTLLSCPVQTCTFVCCMTAVFEKHLEQHEEEKLFCCHPCTYHSYNMRQLECHLESGHKQRPKPHEFTSEVNLNCKVQGCSASFTQENWLMRHIRMVHGEVEKDVSLVCLDSKNTSEAVESIEIVTDDDGIVNKFLIIESDGEVNYEDVELVNNGEEMSKEVEEDSSVLDEGLNYQESAIISSPKFDNTLLDQFTPGTSPGPPLASSLPKIDDASEDSVLIVEISEDVFTSERLDIVPPVRGREIHVKGVTAALDEENNYCPDVELSKDVIIQEVVSVEYETGHKEENILNTVECLDSIVVENTDFVDEESIEAVVSENHDDITGSVESLPVEEEMNVEARLKKSSLLALYLSVVADTDSCPSPGLFTSVLDITQEMLEKTVVPEILEPVDQSSLCKGLAIGLLELQQQSGLGQYQLARFVRELLPVRDRPDLSDSAMVQLMANRLNKMKVQATRFSAKYSTFPRYLDKYLVELCNPFI